MNINCCQWSTAEPGTPCKCPNQGLWQQKSSKQHAKRSIIRFMHIKAGILFRRLPKLIIIPHLTSVWPVKERTGVSWKTESSDSGAEPVLSSAPPGSGAATDLEPCTDEEFIQY